jgi:hypothetical protein
MLPLRLPCFECLSFLPFGFSPFGQAYSRNLTFAFGWRSLPPSTSLFSLRLQLASASLPPNPFFSLRAGYLRLRSLNFSPTLVSILAAYLASEFFSFLRLAISRIG